MFTGTLTITSLQEPHPRLTEMQTGQKKIMKQRKQRTTIYFWCPWDNYNKNGTLNHVRFDEN